MLIFKDLVTGKELFSDAFPVKTHKLQCEEDSDDEHEKFVVCCQAKMVKTSVGGGINEALIGGNPSQEEAQEDLDDEQTVQCLDIVNNFRLEDQSAYFTSKKVLQSYLKKWIKNVASKIEEKDKCENFKKDCGKKLKAFLDMWTEDASVYTGEQFDPEDCSSCPMIGIWNDDGMGVSFYCIKAALCEEKC